MYEIPAEPGQFQSMLDQLPQVDSTVDFFWEEGNIEPVTLYDLACLEVELRCLNRARRLQPPV